MKLWRPNRKIIDPREGICPRCLRPTREYIAANRHRLGFSMLLAACRCCGCENKWPLPEDLNLSISGVVLDDERCTCKSSSGSANANFWWLSLDGGNGSHTGFQQVTGGDQPGYEASGFGLAINCHWATVECDRAREAVHDAFNQHHFGEWELYARIILSCVNSTPKVVQVTLSVGACIRLEFDGTEVECGASYDGKCDDVFFYWEGEADNGDPLENDPDAFQQGSTGTGTAVVTW